MTREFANDMNTNQPSPDAIKSAIIAALKTLKDPEIPVSIWELGLIYELTVSPAGEAYIRMTLTTPNCPVAGDLLKEVERRTRDTPGVTDAKVDLVWEPVWTKDRMSPAARLILDMQEDEGSRRKEQFFKLGRLK